MYGNNPCPEQDLKTKNLDDTVSSFSPEVLRNAKNIFFVRCDMSV